MAVFCSRCNTAEDKQNRPGLVCDNCKCFVHLSCLSDVNAPGILSGDVFFEYTCSDCSETNTELLRRNKVQFTWLNVIYLAIYHMTLHSYGISNHGFFHYKTHIASFIDRNWNILFESNFKQKKNWIGTIAGQLSMHSNIYFRSGSADLNELGWWRLQHGFSPAVTAHISQDIAQEKPKGRVARLNTASDVDIFLAKVVELGYEHLLNESLQSVEEVEGTSSYVLSYSQQLDRSYDPYPQSMIEYEGEPPEYSEPSGYEASGYTEAAGYTEVSGYNEALEYNTTEGYGVVVKSEPGLLNVNDQVYIPDVTVSRARIKTEVEVPVCNEALTIYGYVDDAGVVSGVNVGMISEPPSPYQQAEDSDSSTPPPLQPALKTKRDKTYPIKRNSLFSVQPNSVDMPWLPKRPKVDKNLVPLSEYEERQLLKQIDGILGRVEDKNLDAELRRFRGKLALRRIGGRFSEKRGDFDHTIKKLGGYTSENAVEVSSNERVLDRFQRSHQMDRLSGSTWEPSRGILLVGGGTPCSFTSPYSGRKMKPYIRRDRTARTPWLNLCQSIHDKKGTSDLSVLASIDYSYVRPHHVAAVNTLLSQFFWPGIDMSEALEYPEFSCVVTYKRLVIGCAFLVPETARNEAYVSFLLVRPEWRRAGIGTFMMYHLLQTCTGKDVTLHVSPTNSAIFLYQKFGFKVEELIQDFYEKYYDIDSKECRHALFLRLTR